MRLHVLNSNSQGNAYILYNQDEALLIEAGVKFDRVKQVLNFNLNKVVGCIISHEHKDHCKYVNDVLKSSIDVWATPGTHQAMGTADHHRARITFSGDQFSAGKFKIKPFDVKHDAAEPAGFLINHPECGTVLFLTDSYYSEYRFPGLNNVIIEANYCHNILQERMHEGSTQKFLRDRVIRSHMSLKTCKELLQANDLSKVNNIVLIHLSDGHSDSARFKKEVEQQTGKLVSVAGPGMNIEFNIQPF